MQRHLAPVAVLAVLAGVTGCGSVDSPTTPAAASAALSEIVALQFVPLAQDESAPMDAPRFVTPAPPWRP
ncbi:hypothetical protein ACFWF3_28460, partial [Nocardia sp. NPDC060220]|uniref:hypothetical protein n=1 Tax=Nocardia sp. NPDC060220 TaxID=3347076 RepID=UPI00365CF2D1